MKKGRSAAVLSSAVVLILIWSALTMSLDYRELVLGAVVSILIAAATAGYFTGNVFRLFNPVRFGAFFGYVLFFLGRMVMANIDVFLRVIRPVVPVHPGIVRASLELGSERARTIVANSITLTPGTLTVDMNDSHIYVHWISLPDGDATAETQKMVDGFAHRLEKLFD
ncbi:MAG: Na+/H+ antiporter subunit E [Candidatus Aegiribacteria sp.]|nr:Na+/H+ antiporter subunit E [Candidatus Aegiribacteria sp.]